MISLTLFRSATLTAAADSAVESNCYLTRISSLMVRLLIEIKQLRLTPPSTTWTTNCQESVIFSKREAGAAMTGTLSKARKPPVQARTKTKYCRLLSFLEMNYPKKGCLPRDQKPQWPVNRGERGEKAGKSPLEKTVIAVQKLG